MPTKGRLLALFLVLTSGTAYALAGSNTIFSDDIDDGQVSSADATDDDTTRALRGIDILNGSLTSADLTSGKELAIDGLTVSAQ